MKVEGYAGEPGLNRPNGRGIHLFVNRRPVRDRLLSHAVLESYRNLIPRDRYPVALLFVELPPSEVDVNVHPSKWEVKFSDSETVHRSVIRSVGGCSRELPGSRSHRTKKEMSLENLRPLSPGEGNFFSRLLAPGFQVESGAEIREPSSSFLSWVRFSKPT